MGVQRTRQIFDRGFKLQVMHPLLNGEKRLAQLCREYQFAETHRPGAAGRWEQYEQDGDAAWPDAASLASGGAVA
jgi:hypothetical protein